MTLFNLPKNILKDIIFKLLGFDAIKALSNTCVKGLELFGAKLLTYDDESSEIQDYRAKKLLYVIIHSDQYFKKPTIRIAIYKELLRATQQFNVSVRIRCLQYFILALLRSNAEHHQRFCMLIQIMNDESAKLYACLYAKKFEIPDLGQNLIGKIQLRRHNDMRETIIHQAVLMHSNIEELIQSRINELSVNLGNDKSHVNFFLSESLQYVKFLIDVSETSKNSLTLNFEFLLPHLRNTDHVSELAKLLIILLRYQNNTPSYQYNIVIEIISRLTRLSLFSMCDGYAKNRIIYIVSRLHSYVSELVPLLNAVQFNNLFFYFSGLSLYNETMHCNTLFLQQFSAAYPHVLNNTLRIRLDNINEQSSEAEILCLFSLVTIYPRLPYNKIDFVIRWLIEQTSILQSPYNLKLLSTLSPYFNDTHTVKLYDRLCSQLKTYDVTNIEELMADMHRTVQTSEQIRSSSDIVQSSVFQILSMIYLRLDKNRCKVMADLIVTVAYGNRFTVEYTPNQSPVVEVLSWICGQISTFDKVSLIKETMPKLSRHSFFFSGSELCKASPNCLPFLIDQHVFNTLLEMKLDVVQLPLLPYLDISKLSDNQVQLFINKLEMKQSPPDAEYGGLFYVRKDQVLYIMRLEKYFNREQRILGANYLIKTLTFGSRNVYDLPTYQIINFLLSVLGPDEFIDVLYNDVFDLEHPRHEFCSQLTDNLGHIFAHKNHTPTAWLVALLPRLSSHEFNYLNPAVMIIVSMIEMNYIVVDSALLNILENAVDNLLDMPIRYFHYYDLMITVSKYYGIFDLIRWIKAILQKKELPKGNYEPDDAILDTVKRFVVKFKLSFAAILTLLNNSNETIVHLGYYYIGRTVPPLTVENLSIFYQYLERALDKNGNIPSYIVSILAYYQLPVHHQQLSTIVLRLLLNCQQDRQKQIISTYNFVKLMKPILLSCSNDTVNQIRGIIGTYIRNNYNLHSRNVDLLSELSELCDYASLNIDSELSCLSRINKW